MWSGNSWQFFGGSGPIEYLHYHQKSYLQNIVKSCSSSLWMVIPPTDLWVGVWMVKTTLPYNGQVFQKSQETTVHHMLVCRLCHTYFISQRINTFNVWWSVLKMLRDVNRKQYRHWNQNILDIYIYKCNNVPTKLCISKWGRQKHRHVFCRFGDLVSRNVESSGGRSIHLRGVCGTSARQRWTRSGSSPEWCVLYRYWLRFPGDLGVFVA